MKKLTWTILFIICAQGVIHSASQGWEGFLYELIPVMSAWILGFFSGAWNQQFNQEVQEQNNIDQYESQAVERKNKIIKAYKEKIGELREENQEYKDMLDRLAQEKLEEPDKKDITE